MPVSVNGNRLVKRFKEFCKIKKELERDFETEQPLGKGSSGNGNLNLKFYGDWKEMIGKK